MVAAHGTPQGYPPEIIGYTEPWIADPGESIDVKVCLKYLNFSLPLSLFKTVATSIWT